MYFLGLDLSTSNCGIALFKNNELIFYDNISKTKTGLSGIDGIYNISQNLTNKIQVIKDEFHLNRDNTIIAVERRLSGFSKFSTNKTIESIAQLHYAIISSLKYQLDFQHIDLVNVSTWQNKILNLNEIKKEKKVKGEKIPKNLSKELSLKYIKDNYNIDTKIDDMADAICVAEYYKRYKFFNILTSSNIKEKFYKNLVATQKEEFYLVQDDCKNRKKVNILKMQEDNFEYFNAFFIKDSLFVKVNVND